MPIAPSLQQFVDDELARSAALVEATLRDTVAALRGGNAGAGDGTRDRMLHAELATRLQRQAAIYRSAFVDSLDARVRAELEREDGGRGMAPPSGLGGLTLMDESRVEIDIEISRATQLIDAAAEWELRELQTFTSTLIGQPYVSAESNPLRPMLYAAALWDAACVVHPDPAHRAALLRVSAFACAPLLKQAWAAASTRLESAGVTPGIYRSRVLHSGSVRPAAGDEAAAVDAESAAIHRLLTALPAGTPAIQRGADRFGAAPVVAKPPPAASPAAAMLDAAEAALVPMDGVLRALPAKTLSKVQAAALAARLAPSRGTLAAATTARAETRQTVELLERVFDAMLADPELNPAFVPVVARLQVPALRLALRDAGALASARHPVWQLLDRIGQASASYPQATDPRGAALLALCQRLVDEWLRPRAEDGEPWRKALAKLDEFLAAQHEAQRKVAHGAIDALRDAERLHALEQQISQRLADQMAPLRPAPVVRRFLAGAWSCVLARAIARHGEDAEPARGYIRLVDDLLWSVQSPDHPASRQRLAALLPPMLQTLRDGMASIALPEAEQQAILDELLAIHTAALRRGEPDDTPLASAAEAPRRAVEAGVDAAAPRETMIDLASLETVPAALMPEGTDDAPGDATARHVAALRPADRVRMFVNGRWSRVQLLWRSDRGDFLLFAGEMLGDTHSITRRALERLAAAGLLRALEDQPLSQRALDTVERRLAVL